MSQTYVGLDIETTGTNPEVHKLIQIGIATLDGKSYDSDVGWQEYQFEQEALAVNKFTHERIRAGHRAEVVDLALRNWLDFNTLGKLSPVGWNVGTFDMPFVKKFLPLSYKFFHYRTVDLNAVVATLARADIGGFDGIKKRSKKYAEATLGEVKWHDACHDARAALASWEYLINEIKQPSFLGGSERKQQPLFS